MKVLGQFIVSLFLVGCFFVSCQSYITYRQIAKPAKKLFEEEQKVETYLDSYPDIQKLIAENNKYYFDNENKIKKRVLDSLKSLTKENFIIVDAHKDFNGRTVYSSYFFFKDRIIRAGYQQQDYMQEGQPKVKFIPFVEQETEKDLKKNGIEAPYINDYFNKDSFEEISGPIDFGTFGVYNVTVVINKKIGFYTITPDSTGYHVNRRL